MAPRKTSNTKKGKPQKMAEPPPLQLEEPPSASARNAIRAFVPSSEGLEHMMGFDVEDSSDLSDDATYQSQPNFSFLPSHKHSSPHKSKRKNNPVAHRLASMSTVPNSDLAQPDNEPSTSTRNASTYSSPSVANVSPTPTTNRKVEAKKQNRKQKTPSKLKALTDIVRLQGTVNTLIPKLSFGRVIREILADYSNSNLRVTAEMLECLQEAAEIYIVQLFEDAYKCTVHRGRLTLIPKDMHLTLMIRRES